VVNITSEGLANAEPKTIINVILADDHPLVRQALQALFSSQSDFKILAEASDGEQAVRLAKELNPDVVIMDITMPKINGLEATRQIKQDCPHIKILVLTVHNDTEHILGILEAGAAGYLTKSVFGEEVVSAVRTIMAGESVLSTHVLQQILKNNTQFTSKPLIMNASEKLGMRELEILKLAAKGHSNKDIAQKLNLSLQTIKGYSVSIFSKLGVSSRTEAVVIGLRAGFLSLKDLE
jgi:NarL family two-component system response regulator LiaR